MLPLTIKHYFRSPLSEKINKNLISPESWDCLRQDAADVFAIPKERSAWEAKIYQHLLLPLNAKELSHCIRKNGYQAVYSFGVGAAGIEFLVLKDNPQLDMHCFDYSKVSTDILKAVFIEAKEIGQFDLLKNDVIKVSDKALYLFYRIDTEFSDQQWQGIFKKLSGAGVKNIVFFPERILSVKDIIKELLKGFLFYFRKDIAFAGYYRSQKRFSELWYPFYEEIDGQSIGITRLFHLRLKNHHL